ncbi:sigma factor-like helix-turn-helix DNA-binding protein [Amycolatopsis sp. NPDC051372]|uniref:sigma factor-like helix-turn-helix DNA-binding protein n=1 Tax=unclassified Amycolatopsis TaxID=2618356 RepID=UPI0034143038
MSTRKIRADRRRQGRGEAEIARTLGVPPGTVKSTAHRALATLRRRMKDGPHER